MPIATKVDAPCPRCGDDSDLWMFKKQEPTVMKEQYSCETCGCEWTEVRQD